MDTLTAALTLKSAIQSLVESEDGCEITVYQVTAGEPAAPSGSDCPTLSVWASQYFNAVASMFHEDNPCLVVRGVQLNWRLDVCYSETEQGPTAAEHLADAVCLYGLADTIWCGLPPSLPTLFGKKCADLQFDALTIGERSGGYVSASSGVRFQIGCDAPEVPEDIVGVIAGQEEGGEFG